MEFHRIFSTNHLSASFITLQWTPPSAGAVKLNCDASKLPHSDVVGFGCVIRDNGTWKHGCASSIPASSVLDVKIPNIPYSSAESVLILRIQKILLWPWKMEISLIQKNANRVADALAKHAINFGIQYADWIQPWNDLRYLITDDVIP
ncbi:hypothetical protein PIB30_033138 [Stylosanthes scabra]|uniref:RNase H type-1 domain-containing protein n=1 Tax=Stylosanthes scabra TaxID=79078 RepID=A0ABU6WAV4_9FABA|nr:hypothetical protein [Stylosanthes scabra]